jgi:flagellar motor switch protein FliG
MLGTRQARQEKPPVTALPNIDMPAIPPMPPMPPLPSLGGGSGAAMSRRQKAAIIVRLLQSEGETIPLQSLPEDLQVELTRQMTTMRYIDHETLASVVEEFSHVLASIGLSFPNGLEGALNVLDGSLSAATSSKMRKQAGFSITGDPWERIAELDVDTILPVLEKESPEIAAVLLSKISVAKAAEILGRLPGERARRIAYAVSLTQGIEPYVVQKIGISLAAQLDNRPPKAFETSPVERVGAILNFSASAIREDVLEGLEETDQMFAGEVRKAIFTFANIATRLDGRDVPKVTRDVDPAMLITALASANSGPDSKTTEFILGNMSQRMAQSLQEEIDALGNVKGPAGEEAQNAVVASIRELEAAGEIFLLTGDED